MVFLLYLMSVADILGFYYVEDPSKQVFEHEVYWRSCYTYLRNVCYSNADCIT